MTKELYELREEFCHNCVIPNECYGCYVKRFADFIEYKVKVIEE